MKRRRNWKTWPDQVFTIPAGAAVGATAAWFLGGAVAEMNMLVRILAVWAVIAVAMIPGVLISAVLHHLRRPLPRRRLRDLRLPNTRWLRLLLGLARNDKPATPAAPPQQGGKASGEIYTLLRSTDAWGVDLAERKARFIEQLKAEAHDVAPSSPDDFLTYAQVRAAAQGMEEAARPFSRAEGEMLALMFVWCGLVLSLALGAFTCLLVTRTLQGPVLAGAGASLGVVCLVAAGVAGSVVWVMKRTRRR